MRAPRLRSLARSPFRRAPRKLRTRLTLGLAVLLMVIFAGVGLATTHLVGRFLVDRLDQQVTQAGPRYAAGLADLDHPEVDRIPIGRALPHVRELIEDTGELLIGGPALAAGYLGRPEATAERFVERADGRWFRTGDRVSRGPGGLLFHEGRIDHQIKVRGVRVDPGEVEAHLTRHPAVAAAAVTGVTLAGRIALVGYVAAPESALAGTGRLENTDLLAWLRQRVPAHLVPSRITFVPELVHTTSGKVDRAGTHRRYAPE